MAQRRERLPVWNCRGRKTHSYNDRSCRGKIAFLSTIFLYRYRYKFFIFFPTQNERRYQEMAYSRRDVEKTKMNAKKFVRYQEGAEKYSIDFDFSCRKVAYLHFLSPRLDFCGNLSQQLNTTYFYIFVQTLCG